MKNLNKKETESEEKPPSPRKIIPVTATGKDPDSIGRAYAKHLTGAPMAALRIILAADKGAGYEAKMDYPGLLETLREQGKAVNDGDLAQAEAMLMNQATALQSVAARLLERGMAQSQIPAFEANMRMGLRAQAQCRATLETLAAIKNPSAVAFVRQANIATGPQQVNNGPTSAPSRAEENQIPPNKLLEAQDGERLDLGAASAAGSADSNLETLGAINRPANKGRKGNVKPER